LCPILAVSGSGDTLDSRSVPRSGSQRSAVLQKKLGDPAVISRCNAAKKVIPRVLTPSDMPKQVDVFCNRIRKLVSAVLSITFFFALQSKMLPARGRISLKRLGAKLAEGGSSSRRQ